MDLLKQWIPYNLLYRDNWTLDWLELGDHQIKEPFFDETISICKHRMIDRSKFRSQSSIDFLFESAKSTSSITLTAFIFHVSRCGSTLLSQSLSEDNENIVIAEAPLIDQILRAGEQLMSKTPLDIKTLLKSVLTMMGQRRSGKEKHLFIKLDSWHIHFYKQLREWFPNIPFYFLSREPAEVIASHTKRRGIHSVPGFVNPQILKIALSDAHYQDFNFYTSEVLFAFYVEMLVIGREGNPLNYFYDYSWGVKSMIGHFYAAVKLEVKPEMHKRLNFHSKFPESVFYAEKNQKDLLTYPNATLAYHTLMDYLNRNI